ncbi:MAG TPA: FMN reductase [Micromonospora sp.]|nr:FMN reductase [Micromonospora sp.]
MKQRTLAVVSAGMSQPSSTRLLADQLAAATREELDQRDVRLDIHTIELRDHAHDVVNHLLTGFPPTPLQAAIDKVTGADALIAITPIYNASYSGLFKSFFDILQAESLVDKPVLIAATGGTVRHSLALDHALRPMFTYLRAVVVPTSVFAAPEDWAGSTAEGPLSNRIQRAGRELAEQIEGYRPRPVADPFTLSTTFEQLLSGD